MIRWGLLGGSRILQRALLPAMRAAGHPIVALGARDPARAAAMATALGVPAGCGYQALLERDDVDAVYISIVNDGHRPWIMRALAAGKNVLCEKPLTLGPDEVDAVRAAEAASGCRVMEAFVYGFHPQIASVLHTVHGGGIGRVVTIEAQFCGPLRAVDDFRWQARHGGGALLDLGTYCISLIRDIAGREPSQVAGFASMRGDVDASFRGVLDFGGAFGATFGCSFDGTAAQSCRIIGTAGVIEIPVPFSSKGKALVSGVAGSARHWPPCDPYQAMVEHFAAAVAGGPALRHDTTSALRQASVLDALLRSAREQRVVALP